MRYPSSVESRATELEQTTRALEVRRQEQAQRLTEHRQQIEGLEQQRAADAQAISDLERRLEQNLRSNAHVNAPFFLLTAQAPERGAGDPVEIPATAGLLSLVLEVPAPELYPRYSLRIVDKWSGGEVWRGDGFELREGSFLSVVLPRGLFASGDYVLEIYGLAEGRRKPLVEYALTLEVP